jgi:PKD repeat protein
VLLKGLLLNSANELGNKGPDFKYGWGHINAWKALNLIQKHSYVKGQVDHANSSTHTVAIPLGVVEAKVMLIWAEPHAIPGAAKALINDLDIQVRNTDGDVFLPWKLNPTPDPLTLDLPSGKGRDSLNNVEQVSIEKPSPGTYQVTINGFDVPLGPQSYYVIWEFITEDIKMTYPAGGEGFVPGTKEMIRWDAYDVTESFGLEYSTNGGASFDPLTVLNPTARQYEWTVPLMVNGNVKLRLTRGTFSDTTDYAFSIAPVPQNIVISKVCPDSITVSWSEVNDTLSYDLYLLGSKYMEIKGRFDSATATVPINNPGEEQWASARVAHADGTAGQRAIAVGWPGGLKNCTQNFDLALKNILSPRESFTFSCSSGAGDNSVSVELKNEGQQNISGATIHYQFGNLPVVTETLPDLQVGESVDFTFQTPFSNLAGGSKLLKIWTAYLADSAPFNDTISLNINILDKVITGDFVEDFESSTNLPQGWAIVNPDNWFTWSPSNIFTGLRGINGEPSRTFFVNHYDYEEDQFQEDYLYVAPVDLSTIDQPTLTFDVSHRNFGTDYLEELRVELFPNCNLTNAPIVLLDVKDPELSTTASGSGVFIPTSSNQWRRYSIDLGNYANQTAVIRFVSVNAYGNNTYIDNIGVKKYEAPSIPIAEIVNPFDTLCRLDTVQFLAASLSQEAVYTWAFGTGASPVTATGKGPHTVVYLSAGLKTVRLIASNPYGADTTFNSIVVRAFPTANFTVSTNNLNATFNNTSLNSDYFLWDFGDGSTSTEKNPVHTYSQSGTYPVKLSSSNLCRANEKIIDVTVTGSSGLKEIEEELQVNILPNPTSGNFVVKVVNAQSKVAKFNLLDAQGRLVLATEKQLKQGDNFVPFEGLKLAKGVYQLQLLTENGTKSYSIVVL